MSVEERITGYRFNHQGLVGLASETLQNFSERVAALYEQGADEIRIQQYVRRWVGWCLNTQCSVKLKFAGKSSYCVQI